MEWSKEDLDKGEQVAVQPVSPPKDSDHRREMIRNLMTLGVELAAARAGPMTADELAWLAPAQDEPLATIYRKVLALGARIAVLDNSERALRQRVEKAAEALADVAPGELGRLDLVGRIEKLKSEVSRIKPSGQVAGDVGPSVRALEALVQEVRSVVDGGGEFQLGPKGRNHHIRARLVGAEKSVARLGALAQRAESAEKEAEALRVEVAELEDVVTNAAQIEQHRDDLRAEVERLKAELGESRRRLVTAENERDAATVRLAAIWEIVQRVLATGQYMAQTLAGLTHHPALKAGGHVEAHGQICRDWADVATALREWLNPENLVLEGDAPQETNGAEWICPNGHRIALLPNRTCADCGKKMVPRTKGSAPKCPHENPTFTATGCGQCEAERSALLIWRYPCSPTCTHDDAATPGHPERVMQRSEAVKEATDPVGALAKEAGANPGREVASYRCGYEQACDDMRAACLEAIQPKLDALGVDATTRELFKRAIEGAAP